MASTKLSKIPPSSVDSIGISEVTASRDPAFPRRGGVYISGISDAVPVWFHCLYPDRYVMLMSQYRDYPKGKNGDRPPVVTTPSWAFISPSTGMQYGLGNIPSRLATGPRTLTAAASRGSYLFVLSQSEGRALVQHFHAQWADACNLIGEEWVPADLGLGLFIEKNYLWVYGKHSTNNLAVARRNWGRIGAKNGPDPQMNWLFRTEKGWSSEVTQMAAMDGSLPCDGPVSLASRQGKYYLLATSHRDPAIPDSWTSKAYTSRYPDTGWVPLPKNDITLASTSDLYLGPARLQPQLPLSHGFTSVATGGGNTVLTSDSASSQVFTGTSGHVVKLPSSLDKLSSFTIYNQSTADITAHTSDGKLVATVAKGTSTVLTPNGRHKLFTFSGTATPDTSMFQALMGTKVDPAVWEWIPVHYPHWFPVQSSVAVGVRNCIDAINAWPGKFGLSGYSQGAIVCSGVLWEMKFGSLQDRYQDLIGAVMFGNPLREEGVTIPGGIDPGGAGMGPENGLPGGRIRNTPNDIWWEFANNNYEDPINGLHKIPGSPNGDPFGVTPTTSAGQYITAIYQLMLNDFDGDETTLMPRLKALFSNRTPQEVEKAGQAILHMIKGLGIGHVEYFWSRPLRGSNMTSVELGAKHLNDVGKAAPLQPQITTQQLNQTSTWTQSSAPARTPVVLTGFPYVVTNAVATGKGADATASWLTSWNCFAV